MSQTKYGVGPNGRALKKDGTERKPRATLTALEKMRKDEEAARNRRASVGRDVIRSVDNLAAFRDGIGKVRGYNRTAVEFSTEEKRQAKREWAENYLASIEERGVISEAYLADSGEILDRVQNIEADIGDAVFAFMADNGREPDASESEAIIREHISDEDISFVEDAADPDSDPFAKFRRDADDADDDDDEDSDSL